MSEQEKCPECGAKRNGNRGDIVCYECLSEGKGKLLIVRHYRCLERQVLFSKAVAVERDSLRNQLATVTAERDQLQQRVAELEGLLGRIYSIKPLWQPPETFVAEDPNGEMAVLYQMAAEIKSALPQAKDGE